MASASADVLSLQTTFPISFPIDHRGYPIVLGTSAYDPNRVITYYPITAYYVRPDTDQTYDLTKLLELYNEMAPECASHVLMKQISDKLSPIDDLTKDEMYMIFEWYEQLGRRSVYSKPFILMQRIYRDSYDIKGIIHVNGLIDYVQHEGGVNSLTLDPDNTPAYPTWINDVNFAPTYYASPYAYKYIINLESFGKWMQKYIEM
jgi:hypothetical protein